MYRVTDQELLQISSGQASLHWTFFGMTFGAGLTSLAVLVTGQLSAILQIGFVIGILVAVILTVYFGIRHAWTRRALND